MKKTFAFLLVAMLITNASYSQEKKLSVLTPDHAFIWSAKGAPEMQLLIDKGFTEAKDWAFINKSEGTGSRFIFFLNFYFELIYVNDEATFNYNSRYTLIDTIRTSWHTLNVSPFGLGITFIPFDDSQIPFAVTKTTDPEASDTVQLYEANDTHSHLQEPDIFVMPEALTGGKLNSMEDLNEISDTVLRTQFRNYLTHENGIQKITGITITCKTEQPFSNTVKALEKTSFFKFVNGGERLMELTFDNNKQGKLIDLRPGLPLIIHY